MEVENEEEKKMEIKKNVLKNWKPVEIFFAYFHVSMTFLLIGHNIGILVLCAV